MSAHSGSGPRARALCPALALLCVLPAAAGAATLSPTLSKCYPNCEALDLGPATIATPFFDPILREPPPDRDFLGYFEGLWRAPDAALAPAPQEALPPGKLDLPPPQPGFR